jgi:hypothetical protein
MRKISLTQRFSILFTVIFILSCSTTKKKIKTNTNIKNACDLKSKIDQLVIVEGVYSICMEYSSFRTIEKDKCHEGLKMELNMSNPNLDRNLVMLIREMLVCNTSRNMTLRGILKKEKEAYGHQETLTHEFVVTEVINCEKLKVN